MSFTKKSSAICPESALSLVAAGVLLRSHVSLKNETCAIAGSTALLASFCLELRNTIYRTGHIGLVAKAFCSQRRPKTWPAGIPRRKPSGPFIWTREIILLPMQVRGPAWAQKPQRCRLCLAGPSSKCANWHVANSFGCPVPSG